ncbi:Xylose isomerase-like TIM barrel [Pirellulimonas nuda]|uniref:Xylose isomerase-like TIM barrel n=1 Tax=Pirellulimonas nuda TaxID=2528009 RepID=A0A518D995_9BACT|nr:TIM barrel protein [Pirellulimonas nuda]QDU88035.1 Xylose isomerase-like TIM barrel [Pirellulimonas nuda]
MSHSFPKLHNALWPGVVGKGDGPDQEPPLSLDTMLNLTAAAQRGGKKFDGVDLFLFLPHTDPSASEEDLRRMADDIQGRGLSVGSLVAPVWPGTVGDSAMGDAASRKAFLSAIETACRIGSALSAHGVRRRGVIRVDSAEFGVDKWRSDPRGNTKKIAETFQEAARIAAGHGERLAAEGEICWAGMHSWKDMLDLLEAVAMPDSFGFQADLAHTYLFLLGYNAPEHALLSEGYDDEEFYAAYEQMVAKLRPWTIDIHIAQNDGNVFGAGSHDKTGKHCRADDPNGKLDIVRCASYWLQGAADRGIEHICWDGCMFPNAVLQNPQTWDAILDVMIQVQDNCGWD